MNGLSAINTKILSTDQQSKIDPAKASELKKASRDFEAAFLAEALGHMGFDGSNGVAGATEFSSMLNRAYAERLVDQGGVGLSENIFRALASRAEGN